jgi:phosphatidylethanolamine-binding protein (PEBP) family uncharacterized protein
MQLRRGAPPRHGFTAVAAVLAFFLSGCGGSSPSTGSSNDASTGASRGASTGAATGSHTKTEESVPTVDLTVNSTAQLEPLDTRYTCDGADISPPLEWSGVPAGTAEIDLFVFNLNPIHGKLFASWAVAGIKPSVHELAAGQVPAGAILGRNSYGETRYHVCPPHGSAVQYVVQIYALPRRVPVKPGFVADDVSKIDFRTAKHIGRLSFQYERK